MSETGQTNVVAFPQRKCCECGARATAEVPFVDMDTGAAVSKWFCADHGKPLDEDGLRLLLDVRDAELARLQQELDDARAQIALRQPSVVERDMQLVMERNNALQQANAALVKRVEWLERNPLSDPCGSKCDWRRSGKKGGCYCGMEQWTAEEPKSALAQSEDDHPLLQMGEDLRPTILKPKSAERT